MAEIQKPITMRMDEFKERFVGLLNESNLPAWTLLYLIDPFVKQLQQFDEAAREKEKEDYEKALADANAEE